MVMQEIITKLLLITRQRGHPLFILSQSCGREKIVSISIIDNFVLQEVLWSRTMAGSSLVRNLEVSHSKFFPKTFFFLREGEKGRGKADGEGERKS